MIYRIHILGIEVLRIETHDHPDEPGDCTTTPTAVWFVADDLPTWHRAESEDA